MVDTRKKPHVEVSHDNSGTRIHFRDCTTLDHLTMEIVGPELSRAIDGRAAEQVRVELQQIEFVSSSALSKLLGMSRLLKAGGGRLILENVSPALCEILRITKLDKLIEVHTAIDLH